MEPIRSRGYAQTQGFNPNQAPNTAEQQRRQDEEFIRRFKEVKQAELDALASEAADVKFRGQATLESLQTSGRQELQYAAQRDRLRREKLARQSEVERRATGTDSSNNKFNDALELVGSLSKLAAETYGKVDQIQTEYAKDEADLIYQQAESLGYKPEEILQYLNEKVGSQAQDNANQIIQLEQESGLRQIESLDPALAARLRKASGNSRIKAEIKKAYGSKLGKDFADVVSNQIQEDYAREPDKLYSYQGEQVPISTLNINDPDVMDELLARQVRPYLEGNGLGDASPQGLGNFYKNVTDSRSQFLGKMRKAETSAFKSEAIDNSRTVFTTDPTPLNAQQYYTIQTQNGVSPAKARAEMLQSAISLPQDEWERIGDMPFGPNDKPLREQYATDWEAARQQRGTLIEARFKNNQNATREQELNQIQEYRATKLADYEDGSFDANPEQLQEAATNYRMLGMEQLAKEIEKDIPLTASKQYNNKFLDNFNEELLRGVVPFSAEQIINNPSLDRKTKQAALQALKGFAQTAVPNEVSKEDFKEIETALKGRAKVNEVGGRPANPTVLRVTSKAKDRYRQVYKQELLRTNDPTQARSAAIQDFYAEFGEDPLKGKYRVEDPIGPNAATKSGEFIEGRVAGKAYSSDNVIQDIKIKMHQNPNALSEPELFEGETTMLEGVVKGSASGRIKVPPVYEYMLSQAGGQMSMRALLNTRLKANGIDELPKDVNAMAQQVEDSFDPSYKKFLNYKPNFTRTDIAAVGSGTDAIYTQSTPMQEKIKSIFGSRESPQAGYDAINRGKGGDTPGGAAKFLGKPLTQMTLGEIKQYQNLPLNDPKGIFAAGKYQFIPTTLVQAAIDAGVSDDMVFNEAVQDRIFFVHLDKYGAYGPWEQWWIQQGGSHLALNSEEKRVIETFRNSYDPSKPWRQPRNMRPELLGVK